MADDNPLFQYLHQKFFGAQDEYFDNKYDSSKSYKHDGIVKETRTFTFEVPSAKLIRHVFCDHAKYGREAYTNFRITPSGYVKSVELEVGGQRQEKTCRFKYLRTEPELYQMSRGRAIPRLCDHKNVLNIETETAGTFILSYDVVKGIQNINIAQEDSGCCADNTEDIIYQEQYTGEEDLSDTTETMIRLNYNHPITRIYTHISTDDVKDVRIILNGEDYGLIFKKNYDYYEIDFGSKNSINFSLIDNAILKITTNNPHPKDKVNTFAIGKQVVRRMDGKSGMIFSK